MRQIVFIAGYALTACSSGGSDPVDERRASDAGGGGPSPPSEAQAVVRLNGGAAAGCVGTEFMLGELSDATPSAARVVKNGTTDDGGTVGVSCRVASTGGGFAVSADISTSSSFQIEGSVDASGKTSAGKLTFKTAARAWQAETCTFDTSGPFMGVAAGRYWGRVSCAGAKATTGESCDLFAEVRVEDCAQE